MGHSIGNHIASSSFQERLWGRRGLSQLPFKLRTPRLDILAGAYFTGCLAENGSGGTPLLILWFLLAFVLRVAVLRWTLLGSLLWAVALIFLRRVSLQYPMGSPISSSDACLAAVSVAVDQFWLRYS